jgi:hypothetical protein
MNFQDFAVPDDVHVWETLVMSSIGTVLAAGQSMNTGLINVTMPWQGSVTAELYLLGSYANAVMGVSCWPYGTAPTNAYAGSTLEACPNGAWMQVPYIAQWVNAAKGTVVAVGMQVQCNIATQNWTCNSINGVVRAYRT